MKGLIGKRCKLTIKDQITHKVLYYTAQEVSEVTESHIVFIDKYGIKMAFRLRDLIQISEIQ